ncbi:MAG: Flp pilus assembly protein CpaB [Caldilinea sp. CFX5]|nr:Flp pilus assembly protein CpaB [Caldilinea sp. CFX5]
MQRRGWGTPLLLGTITAILLGLALWPQQAATRTFVVAARDLGAGTQLQPADLALRTAPADQAPADAVDDLQLVLSETLAVVRFAGEPVTLRHLGPAVELAADERGIAVRVQADTGLAGLLRPGMAVGVVATLPEANGGMYAKAILEGLRVLYVPPDFQARPYTPATAQLRVSSDGASSPPVVSAPPQPTVQEGVVVLAASTQPTTILYRWPEGLVESLAATGEVDIQTGVEVAPAALPPARLVVPVELLAALNAADASFTLVMLPEAPATYTTTGLTLAQILVRSAEEGQP